LGGGVFPAAFFIAEHHLPLRSLFMGILFLFQPSIRTF